MTIEEGERVVALEVLAESAADEEGPEGTDGEGAEGATSASQAPDEAVPDPSPSQKDLN
jgi:hypothetical protein